MNQYEICRCINSMVKVVFKWHISNLKQEKRLQEHRTHSMFKIQNQQIIIYFIFPTNAAYHIFSITISGRLFRIHKKPRQQNSRCKTTFIDWIGIDPCIVSYSYSKGSKIQLFDFNVFSMSMTNRYLTSAFKRRSIAVFT